MHLSAQPAQTFPCFALCAETAAFAMKKTIAYNHGALNHFNGFRQAYLIRIRGKPQASPLPPSRKQKPPPREKLHQFSEMVKGDIKPAGNLLAFALPFSRSQVGQKTNRIV
jgi:hypothetical protein